MLSLRPYQAEGLEATHKRRAEGITRQIWAYPTGAGKTVMFVHLVQQSLAHGRCIILVNRDELVRQTVDKLRLLDPCLPIGIVKAEQNDPHAPVVVASVQTLARPTRLQQLASHWELIIVDECHHVEGALVPSQGPPTATGALPPLGVTGNSLVRALSHLGAFNGVLTIGCSATPFRPNGAPILAPVFQEVVARKHLLELMSDGYLTDLVCRRLVVQGFTLAGVRVQHGEYVEKDLEAALHKADGPRQIVEGMAPYVGERRLAVFSPGVRNAEAVTQRCLAQGIPAVTIVGSTPLEERQAAYAAVARGDVRVLSSCLVLTEGFDLPAIDGIVLARPTKSKVLYPQIVGRGLRLSPETGKTNCLVLDATGVTTRQHLFSVAELLGLAPERLRDGESILEAVARGAKDDDEVAAAAVRTKAVNLLERGTVHWVETPRHAFVCAMGNAAMGTVTLRVRPLPATVERYRVEMQRYKAGQRAHHVLAESLPRAYAFGVAADTLRAMALDKATAIDAAWRQRPGSEKQRERCARLQIPWNPAWTQGEASDAMLQKTGDYRW